MTQGVLKKEINEGPRILHNKANNLDAAGNCPQTVVNYNVQLNLNRTCVAQLERRLGWLYWESGRLKE